jgi:hypothetical protein
MVVGWYHYTYINDIISLVHLYVSFFYLILLLFCLVLQTRDGCRMVPFASWVWMLALWSRHKYTAGCVDDSYVFPFFFFFCLRVGGTEGAREEEREGDHSGC